MWSNQEPIPDEVRNAIPSYASHVWWFEIDTIEKGKAYQIAVEPFRQMPRHPLRAAHVKKKYWVWWCSKATLSAVGIVEDT